MKKQCLKHEYIGAFYRQTFNVDSCPYCKIDILCDALEQIGNRPMPYSPKGEWDCIQIAKQTIDKVGI